jgi:hypothetical protein
MEYHALLIKIVIQGIAIFIMVLIYVLYQTVQIKLINFKVLIVMVKYVLLIRIVTQEFVIRFVQVFCLLLLLYQIQALYLQIKIPKIQMNRIKIIKIITQMSLILMARLLKNQKKAIL